MENGKSVGDVIGTTLRPARLEAAMSEKTGKILDAVRQSIRELDAEIDEEEARLVDLRARRYDLAAEQDRIQGDLVAMDYHRAAARNLREGSAESKQAAHVAFVRHMAAQHLQHGTVPSAGSYAADEIEAALDEMRKAVRQ
jgi:cytoplasmic iron level regulating protein YaaA (DUF328/UPF0246 family)